jgi:hypothetical protein
MISNGVGHCLAITQIVQVCMNIAKFSDESETATLQDARRPYLSSISSHHKADNKLSRTHATMSINFPQVEGEILRAWKEINAFETQVKLSEGKLRFNFYDGPPFGMHPSHSIFTLSIQDLLTYTLTVTGTMRKARDIPAFPLLDSRFQVSLTTIIFLPRQSKTLYLGIGR